MSTPTNKGSQNVYFQYGDPLTGAEFDGKDLSVTPLGIYAGGLLSTVDNSDVNVAPWTAVIGDGTNIVTARTSATYPVPSVSPTNNVIVLRWFYATQTSWFVDMLAVSSSNIQTNDLILGVVIYSVGGVITGYNYSTRSNPTALKVFLSVVPTAPASMKVVINGGWCSYGFSTLSVPTQTLSSSIIAPVGNPRIDVVYVNTSGAVLVSTGSEAVSPVPNYPIGYIALATIGLAVGQSSIVASNIQDVRPILIANSVIPAVTADPVSPVNGQIWMRTDF